MKYIFDFDDVLFNNTKQFKENMYQCLDKVGVPRNTAEEYYKTVREKEFSLKNFISALLIDNKITVENLYEEIMSGCPNFLNTSLVGMVKKMGKENCYIITNGEREFNNDKVQMSGIAPLFSEIFIVPRSKKEIIYNICAKHRNEEIIFIDDKIKFIEDIDLLKCPNLKTILYTGQNLESLFI